MHGCLGEIMVVEDLSNMDVVVYALFVLRGYEKKVHTEEIAAKSYELSPEKFGWKLPEFRKMKWPDKDIARVALTDASKQKYGSLVVGRSGASAAGKETDGWILTKNGTSWCKENEERVCKALDRNRSKLPTKDAKRFLRQMNSAGLYKEFLKTGSIPESSECSFTDMLGTSPDASSNLIKKKFERMQSTAELVGDTRSIAFFEACAAAFNHLLSDGIQEQ